MITTPLWGTQNPDGTLKLDDTGEDYELQCSDIVFTNGKYEGTKLSEVGDTWYMTWMLGKIPNDYLVQQMIGKRLKELI